MRFIFFYILILILFFSCSKDAENRECFKSNGAEVNKERNLSNFNTIELDDNFKVFLIQDTINKINIITGENLVNNIKSDIVDSILILKDENKCRWLRSYDVKKEVYIHFKNINYLLINKECDVFGNDTLFINDFEIINWGDISSVNLKLHCNNFRFTMHAGTGTFKFSGITENEFLYFHGNGSVFAGDLRSSYCDVASKFTGDIEVNTDNTLIVSLYSSGNVIYYGNPTNIKLKIKYYSGELIKGE